MTSDAGPKFPGILAQTFENDLLGPDARLCPTSERIRETASSLACRFRIVSESAMMQAEC
jgi:hypothetical protein